PPRRGGRAQPPRVRRTCAPGESYAWIPSAAMRFPVVLFDLDGTVVDSGAIILASMRHAAKEVLGVEPPDEQLMAADGGPGLAAERMQVAPGECAYVGDSPFDIRAAKAAGMHAVAVTWGGIHDREKLEREEPDAMVDTAEELHGVL